ncbi:putative ABC transport system ATP-binding protein [Desulfonatronum thiosulfatophilum]|uniref:Putative ABC transport system ATP-binding protein n=1 Tax=Desulfonatronum thiosulfatophilum TaxID=617002 RepID=A0A1G6EED4_9BACT|nr:ABC transporter ATP-binding protein [Desulfonatronum thiosulfatophilum]SDB55763.1 putative ABC transport system ATP-binding protein [Desulfonatronum thiosulfatophilum]
MKPLFEFLDVKYLDVLDLPDLRIDEGRITALVGASGSGKTTVLRMLNKMISPTSGRILFQGRDLAQEDSVTHRRNVVMLSQTPALFGLTVRDNLLAGLRFQDREEPDEQSLTQILEQVRLAKPLQEAADKLSGGERQRLALGRVLLMKPRVYLLDEPSSALDEETAQLIFEMLTSHARADGSTIVMVTHSKAAARNHADVIIEMSGGTCLNKGCSL